MFSNIGCTGSTDIVLKHPQLGTIEVDVKTSTWDESRGLWNPANTGTVKLPVFPVIVEPDGDVANWRVRWVRNRAPQGWENFWTNDQRYYRTK